MKSIFLGIECIFFEKISESLCRNENSFYQYCGFDNIVGRTKGSEVKLTSSNSIAKKYLYSGRGVVVEGKIYFIEDVKSVTYENFLTTYQKCIEKQKETKSRNKTYLSGILYNNVNNEDLISMIKSFLILYKNSFISEDGMRDKLKKYVKNESINEIMNIINLLDVEEIAS